MIPDGLRTSVKEEAGSQMKDSLQELVRIPQAQMDILCLIRYGIPYRRGKLQRKIRTALDRIGILLFDIQTSMRLKEARLRCPDTDACATCR